ncbi:DnaJ-class molecular chaperone with C-terminal Zn finger domain [Beggiatoa alba B18LD]|uniref:DnaJ-class molecular chaperone with C-terminal Zn finger domain n=1 Tax=Beggiatoa alba B18LD TaxID=395493 RepID=I3CJE9_9GAMM|nr:DnaJ domain-containing protein [Beggiatoa alba]EIJ43742.1 DnaJ-class molecular chaperone with C-terminal Zn finger domain [Beggiatoa alba B18LD]
MTMRDYYQILEITPDADQEEIKRAYRRLAQKYHPDRSPEANAAQCFQTIQEAYDTLKDPIQRIEYNRTRKVIKPYSFSWLRNQFYAWRRARENDYALKSAEQRVYAQDDDDNSFDYKGLMIGIGLLLFGGIAGAGVHYLWASPTVSTGLTASPALSSSSTAEKTTGSSEYQFALFLIENTNNLDLIDTLERLSQQQQINVFADAQVKAALLHYYDKQYTVTTPEQALQILTKLQVKYPQDNLIAERQQQLQQIVGAAPTLTSSVNGANQLDTKSPPDSSLPVQDNPATPPVLANLATPLPTETSPPTEREAHPTTETTAITTPVPVEPIAEPINTVETADSVITNDANNLVTAPVAMTAITQRLAVCRTHINEQRLTYGQDSALNCYREVLRMDPRNLAARQGIDNLKNSFLSRFDSLLEQQRVDKAKSYIRSLERIDPRLPILKELRLKVVELENKIQAASVLFSETANKCAELIRKLSVGLNLAPHEDVYFKENCH